MERQPRWARRGGAGTLVALLLATSTASATRAPVVEPAPETVTVAPSEAPVAVPAVSTDRSAEVPELAGDPGLRASPTSPEDRRSLMKVGDELDVPAAALASYRFAARTLAAADPACRLSWPILAAIGRVESDHGRLDGAELGSDGVSEPAIRGAALDGSGRSSRVPDTDQGRLDGDARWDRAVGPMQFLPSTWMYVGVDADGDGLRSADDLDDAALGAAVYLCAGDHDLGTRAGRRLAVHSYNPSKRYVEAVLRLSRQYAAGEFEELWPETPDFTVRAMPLPMPMTARPTFEPSTAPSEEEPSEPQHETPEPGPEPTVPAAQGPGPSTPEPAVPPATEPTTPEQQPEPPPAAPTETATPEEPTEPTEPTGPAEPKPVEPDPTETPDVTTLVGVLLVVDGAWTVGGTLIDAGDEALLAATALHDLDGDGTVESNLDELTGLVEAGTEHTVEVSAGTEPAVIRVVDGLTYRDD